MRILIFPVAAIPFVLLQLLFSRNSYGWSVFRCGDMGIVVAGTAGFPGRLRVLLRRRSSFLIVNSSRLKFSLHGRETKASMFRALTRK